MTVPITAVGVPNRFVGDGWDPAALLLTIALLVILRLAGVRAPVPSVLGALLGGLLLDLLTDTYGFSPVMAIAVIGLPVAVVALARKPAR